MSQITNTKVAYGKSQALIDIFNQPIVSLRDPGPNDKGSIGQLWVNKTTNEVWMLTSYLAGGAIWTELDNAGAITGIVWSTAAAAQPISNNHGYIVSAAGVTTLTLPNASNVGSVIEIIGEISSASTGWVVQANAGQTITLGSLTSVAGGQLRSSPGHNYDVIKIITSIADTSFVVVRTNDNLVVV